MAESYGTKRCSRCNEFKTASLAVFGGRRQSKDGLHAWCKACLAKARREDRAARPSHYAAIEKERFKRHGASRKAKNRAIYAANRERYQANAKRRVVAMRDVYNANRKMARQADPDSFRERERQWREKNLEAVNAAQRLRWKMASRASRLRNAVGAAIWRCLKGGGTKGGRTWHSLVGYDTKALVQHLERQFLPGMTWENYGPLWHIDHILPVASFRIESPEDEGFKHCWALTNLRPCWAKDNLRKSDKVLFLI